MPDAPTIEGLAHGVAVAVIEAPDLTTHNVQLVIQQAIQDYLAEHEAVLYQP